MYFESLQALWQMNGHGPYVWSAFGLGAALIAANVIWALARGRAVRRDIRRQLERQQAMREKP
ncbi:heme exporter protein CcmD [Isoalcanivorax beigongshangi]|uniref:Heme exporter protein D n=1 Tax=Isoalcanivorax beigongshangi TaxID=3238810 RepID=A0ABV4AHJ2_9GAMM